MITYAKRDFPVARAREILEPGPVVLVTSHWQGRTNIMTMGWHMIMEFTPSLVGCIIAGSNVSFDLIRKSKQCVINVPTLDLAKQVVGIGNSDGDMIDKFAVYGLTKRKATKVAAPLIKECFANFECVLADGKRISKYNMFIFEIVKAHVAPKPRLPKTMHYRGKGLFTVPGRIVDLHKQFSRKENL